MNLTNDWGQWRSFIRTHNRQKASEADDDVADDDDEDDDIYIYKYSYT